jgi:acyl-CoA thioesterase-1
MIRSLPTDRGGFVGKSQGWLCAFLVCWIAMVPLIHLTAAGTSNDTRGTLVVLGDSIAAGHGLDPSEAFPALLQQKIDDARLNFNVVNAGVSGDTTSGGLRRINWLLKRQIDVLLIELGGNDGLRGISIDVTKSNLEAMIDRAREKYPDVKIILAGMQMPPNMGEEYMSQFRQVFGEVARTKNTAFIPFMLEGVGGVPKLNLPDRIHPTAEGQKIVAENAWEILKPILEQTKTGNKAAR